MLLKSFTHLSKPLGPGPILPKFSIFYSMMLHSKFFSKALVCFALISMQLLTACSQQKKLTTAATDIITGAERTQTYMPLLKNKRVAVFANQTSMVGNTHLVDTLLASGIQVVQIWGPEHGFRGDADAGEHVSDAKDKKTGIPIISLYGNHKKPTPDDLKDVDVVVFDIQDVGVRFYTYISSLQYVLEACLENHKPLMVLDRPNPNGFYVDGPVLKPAFKSFVGMQPVPIVYGMTLGEYALMLAGEGWLSEKANAINAYNVTTNPTVDTPFHFTVIKCKNYTHKSRYSLPVMPSPNLKQMQSIYLYPSTCFFEGTVLSEGRGTDYPFQIFGHPTLPKNLYAFTPNPNAGAKNSKCFGQKCYGWFVNGSNEEIIKQLDGKINLQYLIDAYKLFPGKDSFFLKNNFINKLAGNDLLQQQIKKGMSAAAIRETWQDDLNQFKAIRKKYLLYADFE